MREFVVFLFLCVAVVAMPLSAVAAVCQTAEQPTVVEDLKQDEARNCVPRRQEPSVPPQSPPAFEFPDDPAPVAGESVPADVSIASIAAAVVGAVSAYFATRESEDEDDDQEPVAPDVV